MKVNKAGINLIKKYEGFRSRAYRDAVGVWTIGYGHTSMAGAPRVTPGLTISRAEGEAILARDVQKFADKIAPLIKVRLNDNQFSALVSFAYNVGVGGFRRSSVLKRVNAGQYDGVPHRLSLWVKAGGQTLTGLVRRRAAEGELFLTDDRQPQRSRNRRNAGRPTLPVEPVPGKPVHKSTTNFAAILTAIAGLLSSLKSGFSGNTGGYVMTAVAVVIVAASMWIMRERWYKTRNEGV